MPSFNTPLGRLDLTDLMIAKYPNSRQDLLRLINYEGRSPAWTLVGATAVPGVLRIPVNDFTRDRANVLAATDTEYALGSFKVVVTEAVLRDQSMEQVRHLGRTFPPDSFAHLRIIENGKEPEGLTDFTLFTEPPVGEPQAVFLRGEDGEVYRDTTRETFERYSALAEIAIDAALGQGGSFELLSGIYHEKRQERIQAMRGDIVIPPASQPEAV